VKYAFREGNKLQVSEKEVLRKITGHLSW